jgi:hypothetical protein
MAGGAGRALHLLPEVSAPRTLVSGADAVAPVIAVGKASAGIAHHRGFDLPHLLDQFFADTINVWNFGLLTHPEAVVNHSAKIFREVTVDVG